MGTYKFKWSSPDFYSEYVKNGDYPEVDVLYKYRSWDNPLHQKLLTDCVIYLASPKSFEDPYDCHVPEDFPTQEELPDFFYQKSYEYIPNASAYDRFLFVSRLCRESPLTNIEMRDKLSQYLYQLFCHRFGVLSLTADSYNDTMWNKYSDNHKGFCIGYDKKILEKYVGGTGPVVYTYNLPHVKYFVDDEMTQHCKNTFFKEMRWKFEKEYRMFNLWKYNVSDEERNIHIPNEAIVKIILGSQMSEENKNAICNIVNTNYPNAQIIIEPCPKNN